MAKFISLAEYSQKHQVSVSTLRRRIKAQDIECRLDAGKYLIKDTPLETHQASDRPSPVTKPSKESLMSAPKIEGESPLESAHRLLRELKQAYAKILQEKEEQILQLREEVSDLKTLVGVLEQENERLQTKGGSSSY